MPGKTGTGGNTEPMPFMRVFGAAKAGGSQTGSTVDEFESSVKAMSSIPMERSPEPIAASEIKTEFDEFDSDIPSKSKERKSAKEKHRKRSRSRSKERSKKKKRSSRSRSREHSSRKRRDRSRDRHHRDRDDKVKEESFEHPLIPEPSSKSSLSMALVPANKMLETGGGNSAIATTTVVSNRVRKSRWSTGKSFVPGMPTILPSNLTAEQQTAYLLQLEIEDATRKLRTGDFGVHADPAQRSPSPEPIYDGQGKRLNTREIRKRQQLEQSRHEKIQQLLKVNPNFKPPADYRQPTIKLHDKVWIPQDDHPEINFVGLLIGPRGNTLKSLEAETGAKIIIRGKGSVKEGKMGRREGPMPGENEPLHAYVSATDINIIKNACEKIKSIIHQATEIPDGQNELRKLQLRELALLNGTLRPEDLVSGARCSNCGSEEHKTWECPDAPNVTANVICTACGGAGHIARDCKHPRPGFVSGFDAGLDDEYSALMQELGEKKPDAGGYGAGFPRFPTVPHMQRNNQPNQQHRSYSLPSGMPIVRINLSKNTPATGAGAKPPSLMSLDANGPQMPPPWGGWMPPPMGEDGKPLMFPPPYGMQSDGNAPMWPPWPMPPMPVPPPPGSSSSSTSSLMMPPPPPPPPPVDLSSLLPPAPPPPPPE